MDKTTLRHQGVCLRPAAMAVTGKLARRREGRPLEY